MTVIEPQAANELMPLSYSIVDAENGQHAVILMVGDEPCLTLGNFDTPEAAAVRMKEITAKALTQIVAGVAYESEETTESSVEHDGFVWHPGWMSDLQADNWARLVNRDADPVVINRIEVTARPEGVTAEYMPDVPVFMIYFHPGDQDCPGHHYAGPGRAPVWIGEPVPESTIPDAIEET